MAKLMKPKKIPNRPRSADCACNTLDYYEGKHAWPCPLSPEGRGPTSNAAGR